MKAAEGRHRPSSIIDRWLRKVGETLADDDSRYALLSKVRRICRSGVLVIVGGYGVVILLILFLIGAVGEKNMTVAFGLYLPRVIVLIPIIALLPIALIFHRRTAVFLLVSSVFFFVFGMGCALRKKPAIEASVSGETINILTYNRGQHLNQSLQPFKRSTDPDIIALQEAGNRAARYAVAEGYEKYTHGVDVGEFTVLSRYPIIDAAPVKVPNGSQVLPPAARFVIDFEGNKIALYTVHIISPRDTLLYYRRGAFLQGILGLPGTPWGATRKRNQQFWDDRIAEAHDLRKLMDEDPLPTLIVGDFNAPSGGHIHGIFKERFQDAHLSSGSGFGYSFPGVTRNPLSRGGPWMRIDYLFCDQDWQPQWCITEEDRPSQHRAITAQFRLNPEP